MKLLFTFVTILSSYVITKKPSEITQTDVVQTYIKLLDFHINFVKNENTFLKNTINQNKEMKDYIQIKLNYFISRRNNNQLIGEQLTKRNKPGFIYLQRVIEFEEIINKLKENEKKATEEIGNKLKGMMQNIELLNEMVILRNNYERRRRCIK